MKQFVSLSGGKDSTALLLMMLERGERVDAAVYFDAGEWEFPQMHDHIDRLEKDISPVPLVRVYPPRPFTELMLRKTVYIRGTSKIKRTGYGWPSPIRRWCTGRKQDSIQKYVKSTGGGKQLIGFSHDERHRTRSGAMVRRLDKGVVGFPLVEWGVTESDALRYCRKRGYDWGGLYDIFPRVSCFCCPLKSLQELRRLRQHFPDLWAKMLAWEGEMKRPKARRYKHMATVSDLDERFAAEEAYARKFPGLIYDYVGGRKI